MMKVTVLLMEDEERLRLPIKNIIEQNGFEVIEASNIKETKGKLNKADIAVFDLKVPLGEETYEQPLSENTISLLNEMRNNPIIKRTIIYTGSISQMYHELREKIMETGVFYIFYKDNPNYSNEIIRVLKKLADAINVGKNKERTYIKIGTRVKQYVRDEFITRNILMLEIFRRIHSNIESDFILTGDSGTGKNLLSKKIHKLYEAHVGKQVPYNKILCSELRGDSLTFNDRLYGHVKGAFTGAEEKKDGILHDFQNDGVLFLDEWATIPIQTQEMLLHVIKDKAFICLGDKESNRRKVKFKTIIATNENIEELIEKKIIRNDLYQRIRQRGIDINMPSLSERIDDLPDLIDNIIQGLNKDKRNNIEKFDEEILKILKNYNFKDSNIRGLYHILNDACGRALENNRNVLEREDLILKTTQILLLKNTLQSSTDTYSKLIEDILNEAEKQYEIGYNTEKKFWAELKRDLIIAAWKRYNQQKKVSKILCIATGSVHNHLKDNN